MSSAGPQANLVEGAHRRVYAHFLNQAIETTIEISLEDARAYEDARGYDFRDRVSPHDRSVHNYVTVTDLVSGKDYGLASWPCGADCRCAAVVWLKGEDQ